MREDALLEVLLVKAVEETDRSGGLLPFADRERAAREALREAGLGAEEAGERVTPRLERALAGRAALLAGPLLERHPVLRDILKRARVPGWAGLVLLAVAAAAGFAMSAMDGTRRINILAPPFLGLLVWNLLVYALLATGAAHRLLTAARAAAPFARSVSRSVGRRLGPLLAKTAQVDTLLGQATRRFAADWSEAAAPLLAQRVRLWLHLAAAAVAAGLTAGLYLRGIVLRFEAGWESTFLGPGQVARLIGLLFGIPASWAGIALPRTDEQLALLRWDGAGGGGDAAPWIHLIALCLAAWVVVPRVALACAAWLAGRRIQNAAHLPANVATYARAVFGAGGLGLPIAVGVTPYAFDPPPGTVERIADPLARSFGRGARPELLPAVAYGDEGALPAALAADDRRFGGRALLMNLASTPETENHGAAIAAARDHAGRAAPGTRLLVLVDESAYAERFGKAARLEERRNLWRGFVGGYGVEISFAGGPGAGSAGEAGA